MFAKDKGIKKPEQSKSHRSKIEPGKGEGVPHHALPKMLFPKFDGSHPKIWIDSCCNYFSIYNVPERLWVSSAIMHLEGNAAKWYQAYKQTHTKISWLTFCLAVEHQFGANDYRNALTELIDLKQSGIVEDYTTKFEQLQFDITIHSCHYDDLFFTSHYVSGLKDEIRAVVEPQVPTTVHRAAIIA